MATALAQAGLNLFIAACLGASIVSNANGASISPA
jgi:hypothetical protein